MGGADQATIVKLEIFNGNIFQNSVNFQNFQDVQPFQFLPKLNHSDCMVNHCFKKMLSLKCIIMQVKLILHI